MLLHHEKPTSEASSGQITPPSVPTDHACGYRFVLNFAPELRSGAEGRKPGLPANPQLYSCWMGHADALADRLQVIVRSEMAAASVLYLPADLDAPADVQQMQKQCNVQVKHLPQVIHKLAR